MHSKYTGNSTVHRWLPGTCLFGIILNEQSTTNTIIACKLHKTSAMSDLSYKTKQMPTLDSQVKLLYWTLYFATTQR